MPSFLSPPVEILVSTDETDENSTIVEKTHAINLDNTTETNTTQKFGVSCLLEQGSLEVQLVNDTELLKFTLPDPNITGKDSIAKCVVVLFYSKQCPFSCGAAPHFNALARAFPDLKIVAINAMIYNLLNTQNGVGGVPTIILFHNGRAVAKYNESEYSLELFSQFLTKYTGIAAEPKSHVTSADFAGPVASVVTQVTDIYLGIAWAFIIICAVYQFARSSWWAWLVESVKRNWRESEAQAQHEHVE